MKNCFSYFADPLLSGRTSASGKLKPKVFSKTMGQERNVIGGNSPSLHERETNNIKESPTKNEEYEEDKLVMDDRSNDLNSGMVGVESSPHDPASLYNHSGVPAVQSNQLTPSISLTPISHRTSTPPIAKHNMPATAMMTSSISPKPLAKKKSKQSNFTKSAADTQSSRPVLRPNDMTPGVTCSIHCELASGIPTLNCYKCQVCYRF